VKPFEYILNLGYNLCKCNQCKQQKKKRSNLKTAARQKVKQEIKKEIE